MPPEDLARNPDAFLPPRFREILGDGDGEPKGEGPPTQRDAGTGVFYRSDELITLAPFVAAVEEHLARSGVEYDGPEQVFARDDYEQQEPGPAAALGEALALVARFRVFGSGAAEPDSMQLARDLKRAAADPDSEVPEDIAVGPHVVLTLAPTPAIGPGSDPLPALAEEGIPCGPAPEASRPVGVVDTGLWRDATAWGFVVDADDEAPPPVPGQVVPSRETGHGGFIAWLVNCVAPGTKVAVKSAFGGGGLTEENVVAKANELIAQGFRILNLSLGTKRDTCFDTDLVILRQAMEAWRQVEDLLIVAAAGNDASNSPWFPAGYAANRRYHDMVVSVGALERDDDGGKDVAPHSRVAKFSNYGTWVTAWAPGVDLVSAYPPGVKFAYFEPSGAPAGAEEFTHGIARWSGTSFATPIVAARIAAVSADRNPRESWAAIRHGRPFVVVWPDWLEAGGEPCVPKI